MSGRKFEPGARVVQYDEQSIKPRYGAVVECGPYDALVAWENGAEESVSVDRLRPADGRVALPWDVPALTDAGLPPTPFEVKAANVYDEQLALLLKKHHDYGPKNIAGSPGGPLNGLRVRIWDKIARINNLIDSGAEPENESLRDSFVDLMNYAAIAVLVIDGDWPDA